MVLEMSLRRVHRWLATLGMIFLLYVALTGTLLQLDEMLTGSGPNIVSAGPPPVETHPAPPRYPPGRGPHTLNALLEELHNGSILGLAGRWIDLTVGITFIVLSVTGGLMYFQMLWGRRARGRSSWFWQ
jgi:uncharacterized iron-regulated membrane protein